MGIGLRLLHKSIVSLLLRKLHPFFVRLLRQKQARLHATTENILKSGIVALLHAHIELILQCEPCAF